MTAEEFVSKLEHVSSTGKGMWKARCPAHPDRGPSLSITQMANGIRLKCFVDLTVVKEAIEEKSNYKKTSVNTFCQRLAARQLISMDRAGVMASSTLFG